jgi:hypothetical protein
VPAPRPAGNPQAVLDLSDEHVPKLFLGGHHPAAALADLPVRAYSQAGYPVRAAHSAQMGSAQIRSSRS